MKTKSLFCINISKLGFLDSFRIPIKMYRAPGFVNFVLALAYHFYLNLPAAFTQPGARLLVEPCTPMNPS